MASTSNQDEVFGLPFLFTGGLPNSLEKFSEGNLRCFLIYLIEVVGKANRQNVWQKPAWWKSKLIPYSPISVDTSRVPTEQVVKELRSLVENCYKFYKAEKILEVSRQLAGIPRILLGLRDNHNNTMTVYDTNSKAVYVTVRPENLYYDEKSLNKVSKDWRSNYQQEDVSFCEIKKASKDENKFKRENNHAKIIVLSDSDDNVDPKKEINTFSKEKGVSPTNQKKKSRRLYKQCLSPHSLPSAQSVKPSRGVVVRSGNEVVIALTDSDEEPQDNKKTELSPVEDRIGRARSMSNHLGKKKKSSSNDYGEDVEFICSYTSSKPCPKRFKKSVPTISPSVIILSDTDDDNENVGLCISSYTSLAVNYSNKKFHPETPNKNMQKSILGPLICSPRNVSQTSNRSQNLGSLMRRALSSTSPSKAHEQINSNRLAAAKAIQSRIINRSSTSDTDDDLLKPTREELFLQKKKKNRTFYPMSPQKTWPHEAVKLKGNNQEEFMSYLGMSTKKYSSSLNHSPYKPISISSNSKYSEGFLAALRSMRTSFSRMPLDWIQILSSNNHIILTKRSSRRQFDPTKINYEPYCCTDRTFIEYSIKSANTRVQKEGRSDSRQASRRGVETNSWTTEKWMLQSEEGSKRSKRASLRMLRSLLSERSTMSPIDTLMMGTLAPKLCRLPINIFEKSLQMTINIKDPI